MVGRSYGNNIVYTDWQRDNYFVAIKEALGNARGNIGVEFDHLSFQNYGYAPCSIVIIQLFIQIGNCKVFYREVPWWI